MENRLSGIALLQRGPADSFCPRVAASAVQLMGDCKCKSHQETEAMLTRDTSAATRSTRDSELIGGPMAVVAAAIALMFVGATLPTPLYPLYREAFGFSGV